MHSTIKRKLWKPNSFATKVSETEDEVMNEASHAPSFGRWRDRRTSIAAVALAVFIVIWALATLAIERLEFAVPVSTELQGSEVMASGLAQLFAALVLGLFLTEGAGRRLRWVSAGLVALGLGHLAFGYIEPMVQGAAADLNEALYESLVAQIFACALFVIGLFPNMHRYLVRVMMVVPLALIAGYLVVFEALNGEEWMPKMVRVESPEEAIEFGTSFVWLTPWHWILVTIPLLLAVTATVGAFRQRRRGRLQGWLLAVVVLLAGSVLHNYLWPSSYGGDVLTTADMLQLALAIVAAVGGVVELRRIAMERTALLASERERTRRLHELNDLRADFSAMIAHELGGPLTAIRKLNEILTDSRSNADLRRYASATIDDEIETLTTLVDDVRTAAAVESDDFEVEPCRLPLATLLADARAYANTLAGHRPVEINFHSKFEADEEVWADRKRIGQVFRNLLSNAARYSPEGAPIEVRTTRRAGRVLIEVADRGPGIRPDDVDRIFEKFGRGREQQGRRDGGMGLGLYLSRRIVRAHNSELSLDTKPGKGSVFRFDLRLVK